MRILARDVAEYVAADHSLTFADLTGPCRRRPIARPRQIAMYAIKHLCDHMSYPAIGRLFGGRDHTTVLHGVRKVEELIQTNPEVARAVRKTLSHFAALSEVAAERDTIHHAIAFQALCASYGRAMRQAA